MWAQKDGHLKQLAFAGNRLSDRHRDATFKTTENNPTFIENIHTDDVAAAPQIK